MLFNVFKIIKPFGGSGIVSQHGFSMIQLMVAITLASLLTAGTLQFQKEVKNYKISQTTKDNLDEIDKAIKIFVKENGRLPCVAPDNARPDSANFGIEVACTASAAPSGVFSNDIVGTSGGNVAIWTGTLPTRTLSLPDRFMLDGYKRRYKFVITKPMAVAATYFSSVGEIPVVNAAGASVLNGTDRAAYAVISTGVDGIGATTIEGNLPIPCNGVGLDIENCDNDGILRSALFLNARGTATHFDDKINYKTKADITQMNVGSYLLEKMPCNPPSLAPGTLGAAYTATNMFAERCVTAMSYSNALFMSGGDPRTGLKIYEKDVVAQASGSLLVKTTIPVSYPIQRHVDGEFFLESAIIGALYINGVLVSKGDLVNPFGSNLGYNLGASGMTGFLMGGLSGIVKGNTYKIEIFVFTFYDANIFKPVATWGASSPANSSPVLFGTMRLGDRSADGFVEIMESSL